MTYRYYYCYDPERISACPLTVHVLLHIADSIAIAGPVFGLEEAFRVRAVLHRGVEL